MSKAIPTHLRDSIRRGTPAERLRALDELAALASQIEPASRQMAEIQQLLRPYISDRDSQFRERVAALLDQISSRVHAQQPAAPAASPPPAIAAPQPILPQSPAEPTLSAGPPAPATPTAAAAPPKARPGSQQAWQLLVVFGVIALFLLMFWGDLPPAQRNFELPAAPTATRPAPTRAAPTPTRPPAATARPEVIRLPSPELAARAEDSLREMNLAQSGQDPLGSYIDQPLSTRRSQLRLDFATLQDFRLRFSIAANAQGLASPWRVWVRYHYENENNHSYLRITQGDPIEIESGLLAGGRPSMLQRQSLIFDQSGDRSWVPVAVVLLDGFAFIAIDYGEVYAFDLGEGYNGRGGVLIEIDLSEAAPEGDYWLRGLGFEWLAEE